MGIKKPDQNNIAALKNRVRIPLEKIRALSVFHRETIAETYLDPMGHMNVRIRLGSKGGKDVSKPFFTP